MICMGLKTIYERQSGVELIWDAWLWFFLAQLTLGLTQIMKNQVPPDLQKLQLRVFSCFLSSFGGGIYFSLLKSLQN